jgi:hypothetical protein
MPKSRRLRKSRSHKRRGGQFSFSALKDRAKAAASSASQYASDMKTKLNSPEMQQKIADYKARASEAASQGYSAAKQGASSAYSSMNSAAAAAKAKFCAGTDLNVPTAAAQGGRRRRRRGGQMVTGYNNYNDPFTMNASPVSGYQTAMPHNWVGGRTKRRTRKGGRSRRRR